MLGSIGGDAGLDAIEQNADENNEKTSEEVRA